MDTVEARRTLGEHLAKYRPLPYADLVGRIEKVESLEIPRGDKRPWQLEFLFYWDGEPGGNVRVIGSIDDGGLRAFFPLSDSFIKGPSGEFIGE
jgi:hypothetical protein